MVLAVYFGSRAAAGFGNDVRAALFHQVTDFSAREVAHFGAPSLITRVTNDVSQVQTLVQMICTLLLSAPFTAIGGIILASREDVGLIWILVVAIPLSLWIWHRATARAAQRTVRESERLRAYLADPRRG